MHFNQTVAKTTSTKANRVYEKRVPKRQKNLEIFIEQEQPKCKPLRTIYQPQCEQTQANVPEYKQCVRHLKVPAAAEDSGISEDAIVVIKISTRI
ncbi:hypothetical protein ACTXT7_005036 [Hymenolepis weldensis]